MAMSKELRSAVIAGVVFLLLAVGAGWQVSNTSTEIEKKSGEIKALEKKIGDLTKKIEERNGLEEQLNAIKLNLNEYVEILPSPEVATEEGLLQLVQNKSGDFEISSLTIKEDKKKKSSKGKKGKKGGGQAAFEEILISIRGRGTFEQFLRFLNELERLELETTDRRNEDSQRFLRVNSFSCVPPRSPEINDENEVTWPLTVSLEVSTYRYQGGN